jgi:hypothetical protein
LKTNHIGGVTVSMLASSAVYHGFEHWSGQTKDYKQQNLTGKFGIGKVSFMLVM